jgi:hypothetical protein
MMKTLTRVTGVLIVVMLTVAPAMSQASGTKAADCSTYARNRSEAESSTGRGALRSGVIGGGGGALFGAILGGSKGAKRGAALGGILGVIGGGVKSSKEREASYQRYFDACMRGEVN